MSSNFPPSSRNQRVLVTGATGYVGSRLVPEILNRNNCTVRCFVRSPEKLEPSVRDRVEIAVGDIQNQNDVQAALSGVDVAYYLIHGMGQSGDFRDYDQQAARKFSSIANDAGVSRIVYLGGLGDDNDPGLSPHLKSRHEVGEIFRSSGVLTVELRASVVLGPGSLSYELIRSLTNRLPVMICPRWLATPTQPISIEDVIAYLAEAKDLAVTDSDIFEIGSRDVVNYGKLIKMYAKQKGLTRVLISVPLLTPYLSSLWLGLVTPTSANIGRHLIEGLRNPTVVRDDKALRVFSHQPMDTQAAIAKAVQEESTPKQRCEVATK